MADQDEDRVRRWFLKRFQQGIGRIAVHVIRRIDQDNPARLQIGPLAQKGRQAAHVIDPDLRIVALPVVVPGAAQDREVGMRSTGHLNEQGIIGVSMQRRCGCAEQAATRLP